MGNVYTVQSVVCDWGVYENGKLIVVVNSYSNAKLIVDILNADIKHERYKEEEE